MCSSKTSRPFAAVYVIHGATETKEWDKVVHTRINLNKATSDFWAALEWQIDAVYPAVFGRVRSNYNVTR